MVEYQDLTSAPTRDNTRSRAGRIWEGEDSRATTQAAQPGSVRELGDSF